MYTARIYKIVCDCGCGEVYIGSTRQSLSQRWGGHKSDAKKKRTRKICCHMNEVGHQQMRIVLVHEFECRDKAHQNQIEDQYIQKFDSIQNGLNGYRAHLTVEEKKQQQAEYDRRPERKQRKADHYRKYYQQNAEQLRQQKHKYYQRPEVKQHVEQPIECECGSVFRRGNLSQHRRSRKHQQYQQLCDFIYS